MLSQVLSVSASRDRFFSDTLSFLVPFFVLLGIKPGACTYWSNALPSNYTSDPDIFFSREDLSKAFAFGHLGSLQDLFCVLVQGQVFFNRTNNPNDSHLIPAALNVPMLLSLPNGMPLHLLGYSKTLLNAGIINRDTECMLSCYALLMDEFITCKFNSHKIKDIGKM